LSFFSGQWNDLISKLAEGGYFKCVQAVCDVSGSMAGTPMEVAIALGLVVAELTEEPFKNKLITFDADPILHTIEGKNLRDRVLDVSRMAWGGNTDLLKVFELLLHQALESPGAKMVEKLFIFTDMQFDQATCEDDGWETTYSSICKMFAKENLTVPKIVFWNLRATHKSAPVTKDQVGTALISGFSSQMMKAFLDNDTVHFNPLSIMNEVLQKYEIDKVPAQERLPIDAKICPESLEEVEKIVAEFLVPKKIPRKKGHVFRAPSGDYSGDESDDDSASFHLPPDASVPCQLEGSV
jgi:Domain of unknown function (DUF2828)